MILVERHDEGDLGRLETAWSNRQTFAFIPEKAGVGEAWVRERLALLPDHLREHHFALLTSGTTGQPKLVVGSRQRAEQLARRLHEVQQSEPVEETVLALPLTYCYAFVNQWLWARTFGRRLIHTKGFSQPDLLGKIMRNRRNAMICLVGVQVPLLGQYFPDASFEGVIRVHFAGGRFPQAQLDAVRGFFPAARIFNNYGCAEAMPRLTVRAADAGAAGNDIGTPIEGVQLRTNSHGAIEFRSAYAATAMVDERGVRELDDQEWIATGDLGSRGADGHWHLSGRASEVFKRHGEKVALLPLTEAVHQSWPGAAAFYRELDAAGEDGHVLVLAPSPAHDDVRSILQRLRAFPRAHWPLRIESVPSLPTLPNGKIDVAGLASLPDKTIHWRQRL